MPLYFWLTGALSSVLDNAPTYLVFFDLAGGDPVVLDGAELDTLLAISCGAVFMGANTYLGNAPNFMVRAICEEQGIRMPGFFAYLAWSGADPDAAFRSADTRILSLRSNWPRHTCRPVTIVVRHNRKRN